MSDLSGFDRMPSRNGASGTHAEPAPENTDRDHRGRFVRNNRGGPGNPFARKVAALRAALLASVTDQDIQEVRAALLLEAKKGNVAAARLFLAYTVGKPADTVNPDCLDTEEWQVHQQNVVPPEEIQQTFEKVPIQLANEVARAALPVIGDEMADRLLTVLKTPSGAQTPPPAPVADADPTPVADAAPAAPGSTAPLPFGSNGESWAEHDKPAEPRHHRQPDGSNGRAVPIESSGCRSGATPAISRNPLQRVMAAQWLRT